MRPAVRIRLAKSVEETTPDVRRGHGTTAVMAWTRSPESTA